MGAKLVQVIETDLHLRGEGTEGNPYRRVTEYYAPLDGQLMASAPDEYQDKPFKKAILAAINDLDTGVESKTVCERLEAVLNGKAYKSGK